MLPSQFARPKGARSHMYRRPRRKRWSILIALVAIAGCSTILFKWWPGSGGIAPAEASTVQPQDDAKPKTSATGDRSSPAPASKITSSSSAKQAPPGPAATSSTQSKPESTLPKIVEQKPLAMADANKPAPPVSNPTLPPAAQNPIPANSPPQKSALPPTAPPSPPPKVEAVPSATRAAQRIQAGMELIKQNKPVEARRMLTLAMESAGISPTDAEKVRNELTKVNQRLVFSPEAVADDPFCKTYAIEGGDALSKLPKKLSLHTEYLFLKRINAIENERRLRVGQRIKTVTGPFHAVVDKRAFRMDLYLGDGDQRVYVCSFRVGLGEYDATPEGVFEVKRDSKLINPAWANPRTGEQFAADDPKNPLGEYWIGLVGASDNIRGLEGYGVHGTVEPESIGQMKSMGCVRMLHDDVALVYELLMPGVSTVTILGADYQ